MEQQTQPQPQTIEPTAMIAITLQAQEWNQVLAALSDGPYRIVAPLINKITQQAQTQPQPQPQPYHPNGSEAPP